MARKRSPTDLDIAEALRLPDAARCYSVGQNTLRNAISAGKLEASKLGDSPRSPLVVTRRAMDQYLESCRVRPQAGE